MEGGVRRNIALKLKPSAKDSGPHKPPSDGSRKKEAQVREAAAAVEDVSTPPPPPPPEQQPPPTRPHPLTTSQAPPTTATTSTSHTVTTSSTSHTRHTSTPGPTQVRLSSAGGAKKVPPEGTVESGAALRWDQKPNLLGRPVQDPLMHLCEACSLPVLIYGRMKRCRHAFCRDCAKKAGGVCPRCKETEQTFEEASMGNVYICTHGGGRYDNKGCGRSYLSQRDLEAHVTYRHKDKSALPPPPPGPPGVGLTSQNPLPAIPMPPFFTMTPGGLPPNFSLPAMPPLPPPNIPGPSAQHMFPPRLPQVPGVFVSQGNTIASATGTLPPTWTTAAVFK